MNIFVLDYDITKCAEYHNNKHVVKMILESAQMLCTNTWVDKALGYIPRTLDKYEREELRRVSEAARDLPIESREIGYMPAMENHPCTIWARSSFENFCWLHNLANALNDEYGYRYKKSHKSIEVINRLPELEHMEDIGLTDFAQAMPDMYKNDDPVTAYRRYYIEAKAHLADWHPRQAPAWVMGTA